MHAAGLERALRSLEELGGDIAAVHIDHARLAIDHRGRVRGLDRRAGSRCAQATGLFRTVRHDRAALLRQAPYQLVIEVRTRVVAAMRTDETR